MTKFVEAANADDLADGGMIRADVDGTRVLVARVDGELYAMRSVCTHERAFLDEGTLAGYEATCPLHFSCFDIRNGEVTAPPAEEPEPVYDVKVEDGKVLVSSEPVDPAELDKRGPAPGEEEVPSEPEESGPGGEESTEETAEDGAKLSAPLMLGASSGHASWSERAMRRLESLSPVRKASDRLTGAISPLRERDDALGVLDVLHGRWFGHALHPPLSDLPIGLWTGSFVLDAAGKDEAARLLGIAGTVGGVAAMATGIADWSVSDGRDRRLGMLHGLLNTAGLALQLVSLVERARRRRGRARVWSGVGLATTYASAYIGGHLVMERGAMVNRAIEAAGPQNWTPAVKESDLPEGETRQVRVGDSDVLLYRNDGRVSAIGASCSHAGAPLGQGPVEDGVVTCPWHGSRFDLVDGRALRGPAQASQPVLDARLNGAWIEVRRQRRDPRTTAGKP